MLTQYLLRTTLWSRRGDHWPASAKSANHQAVGCYRKTCNTRYHVKLVYPSGQPVGMLRWIALRNDTTLVGKSLLLKVRNKQEHTRPARSKAKPHCSHKTTQHLQITRNPTLNGEIQTANDHAMDQSFRVACETSTRLKCFDEQGASAHDELVSSRRVSTGLHIISH